MSLDDSVTNARVSYSLQTASPITVTRKYLSFNTLRISTKISIVLTSYKTRPDRWLNGEMMEYKTIRLLRQTRTRAGRVACGECWRQRRRKRGRAAGGLVDSTSAACSICRAGTPQRHNPFVADVCNHASTIEGGILDKCIKSPQLVICSIKHSRCASWTNSF